MKQEIKLGIIVPMYNVAPYLSRCLHSLANQDIPHEDYEIICINDGSPDNCSAIVRELQIQIPNIILLEQENQGVSMARNNGMAIAKGKYMMPIDPDDYVVPNCLKQVLEQAEQNNLDVLYAAFEIFDANHESIWRTNYEHLVHKVDNGQDGYFAVRGAKVMDPDRSVAILYRMDMLRNYQLNYPQDVPYLEDGLFIGKVFAVANRVGYSNVDFYQRTTRAGSATNSNLFYTDKAIDGFIKAALDVKQFAKENNLSDSQKELVNHLIAKFVILSLSPSSCQYEIKQYISILSKLKTLKINKLNIYGLQMEYKRLSKIYNFSPLFFFFYFPFFKRIKNLVK
jgi:glycosyltransferase involved in cell wall biosynthesis